MNITAKNFTATTSTLATEQTHIRTYTVELNTDGAVVSYQLQSLMEHPAARNQPIIKPLARQVHPNIAESFVNLIDLWFEECPWEQVPMALVRELLRIRDEFQGVWIESL